MSKAGQKPIPYPMLAMHRAAGRLCWESSRSLFAWSRKAPTTTLDKNRNKARDYLLAIGNEILQRAKRHPAPGVRKRSPAFLSAHPGVEEQYRRMAAAVRAHKKTPEVRAWAEATRLDLRNREISRKLTGCFADHILDIAWTQSFYPVQWLEGEKTDAQWPALAAELTDRLIARLEADKPIIFVRMFPRRQRLPTALRNLII